MLIAIFFFFFFLFYEPTILIAQIVKMPTFIWCNCNKSRNVKGKISLKSIFLLNILVRRKY